MSASTAAAAAAASTAVPEVCVCTVIAFVKNEHYHLTPFTTAAANALEGCVCNRFCQN